MNSVCSMITRSENAALQDSNIIELNLSHDCDKQECQDFFSMKQKHFFFINKFSLSKHIEQEKVDCQPGIEPGSLNYMPSVIPLDHWQSRFSMLSNSQLRVLHCPIYDLDNLDACTLHAVLWDVHAHVHHPLIEEMLMHMCTKVVYHYLPNNTFSICFI